MDGWMDLDLIAEKGRSVWLMLGGVARGVACTHCAFSASWGTRKPMGEGCEDGFVSVQRRLLTW